MKLILTIILLLPYALSLPLPSDTVPCRATDQISMCVHAPSNNNRMCRHQQCQPTYRSATVCSTDEDQRATHRCIIVAVYKTVWYCKNNMERLTNQGRDVVCECKTREEYRKKLVAVEKETTKCPQDEYHTTQPPTSSISTRTTLPPSATTIASTHTTLPPTSTTSTISHTTRPVTTTSTTPSTSTSAATTTYTTRPVSTTTGTTTTTQS